MIEMRLLFGKNSAKHMALLPNQYLDPVTYGLSCLWLIQIQMQEKSGLGSEIFQVFCNNSFTFLENRYCLSCTLWTVQNTAGFELQDSYVPK